MKRLINFTILSLFFFTNLSFGDNSKDIAIILKFRGSVKVRSANPGKWRAAKRGMRLNSGDIIKTGDNAITAIMFTDDKSLLKVRENSTLVIKGKRKKSSIAKRLKFAIGKIWVKVKKQKSEFLVETPSGVAAVKGTNFAVSVDKEGSVEINCFEGLLAFKHKLGEALIRAGETGLASKVKAMEVHKTDSSKKDDWTIGEETENYLEFEFEDEEGNKKTLKINYQNIE